LSLNKRNQEGIKLNILISNDDGIYSKGIYELAKKMQAFGRVTVVAPDKEQSATSHAITMHQPLRCKKIKLFDLDIDAWWVSGTPADCIKLGIETLLPDRPQLVLSGINNGENLGTDIIYSGTVSAAIEGHIFNIPSMAVSYDSHGETDFALAAEVAARVIGQVLNKKDEVHSLLNINIPNIKTINDVKGIKITKLGVKKYRNNFEERKDPRGNSYYWLAGELVEDELGEDTDIYAVRNGYVSITPLRVDFTGYDDLERLRALQLTLD
jgi:5'-nucleotidase